MTEHSNGVVILITLLNVLVYKLQKLQEAQQKKRIPLSIRQLCRRFSLEDIKSATSNFKEELVIGKGGFGIVYRGIIDFKDRIVAIKRAKAMSKQGSKEFLTEIKMLSQFQHSHLVSLVGYCDDYEEMILVYDYMPSGTLADHLYKRVKKGATSFPCLSWVQRLKICIGAAHGLDYLHSGTGIEDRVIHRDVKTSNILLDENLAAKVSDFGLSKTGPANQTCTYVSTRVKGTPGYLDPYYVATHRLTRKTDVYSFGVVLFEVLCGRPAVDTSLDEEQISLAGWAQHCFKEGLLEQIIDSYIKADISSDSLTMFVDIAIKCLHNQPKLRPTMAEVVVALESALALQEKSTHYSLVEILPSNYNTEEDINSSTLDVRKICNKREHECMGEAIVSISNDWHQNKQYSVKMTFTKRISALLTFKARALSGNGDAETSRYRNNAHSVNINKSQVAKTRTFIPVNPPVLPTHWRQLEEVLQSTALKNFKFNDLKVATREFHHHNVIGQGKGGSGTVFKGWVHENSYDPSTPDIGLPVAVKRFVPACEQGQKKWQMEIDISREYNHPNFVKLLGYCSEGQEHLLVYEYMQNSDLDSHIFKPLYITNKTVRKALRWEARLKIMIGAARCLAFFHTNQAKQSVICGDFKTSRILLDEKFNAKLSPNGLERLTRSKSNTDSTASMVGTLGYAAPENLKSSVTSLETDVYAFGVVFLELMTGIRAAEMLESADSSFSTYHVDQEKSLLHYSNNLNLDPWLEDSLPEGTEHDIAALITGCIDNSPSKRPSMLQVVEHLERICDSCEKYFKNV